MDLNLEFTTPDMASDITSVLRRRGLEPRGEGSTINTLYPGEQTTRILQAHGQFKYHEYFSNKHILDHYVDYFYHEYFSNKHILDHYVDYFGQNKFRKMVRRLLRGGRQWTPIEELTPLGGSKTAEYLLFLERLLLLERNSNKVKLAREINDLGASLEHYVAQICIKKLRGSAEWRVHIGNLPRSDSGGDFDVLTWLEPSLIYVECKSSPPSNIGEGAIREFLQRSFELAPDLAILLIDTEDDLTPFVHEKINPIIREEFEIEDETHQPIAEEPDYPRVSFGARRIYVTNSRKTILSQLRRCLQLYYAQTKHASFYGGPTSVNFTRTKVHDE